MTGLCSSARTETALSGAFLIAGSNHYSLLRAIAGEKRLASFSRQILFDERGTGLSDRVADMPSLEVRMDDVREVMDLADLSAFDLSGNEVVL